MLFWEKVVMSFEKHIKPVLIAVGVAFLVWGCSLQWCTLSEWIPIVTGGKRSYCMTWAS